MPNYSSDVCSSDIISIYLIINIGNFASLLVDTKIIPFDKMSGEDLHEDFQTLSLEEEYLEFNPTGENKWLKRTFDDIPRYLFRVSTPVSNGLTTDSWAKSKDAKFGHPTSAVDIFSRDENQVADMLGRHLWWTRNEQHSPHNLLSWTSSLLFAIQYIFLRHHEFKLPLENIDLYIIDTTKFPKGVFARDMDLVKIFSPNSELERLDGLRNRKHREYSGFYYFGEYLSQGALKIKDKCSVVSAQEIIEAGLFRLRPEFELSRSTNKKWANEVIRLREIFAPGAEKPRAAGELQAAIRVGNLFGPNWRLPVAASLIALQPCKNGDMIAILQEFGQAYPG